MNARSISITIVFTVLMTMLSGCGSPLSPEEVANEGTHIYLLTSERDCTLVGEGIFEKFKISFSGESVKIEKLEPEKQAWTNTYSKVSANTYVQEAEKSSGEIYHITIEFNETGFRMSSDAGLDDCGAYIRILMP